MKFNFYVLIGLVLLLFVTYTVQNTSKNTEKRKQSMMEYVNDFFSEDGDKNKKMNQALKTDSDSGSKKRYSFKETSRKNTFLKQNTNGYPNKLGNVTQGNAAPASGESCNRNKNPSDNGPGSNQMGEASNSTNSNSTNGSFSTILEKRPETPEPILSAYFMISSAAFRDVVKFPPIRLATGEVITIQTDLHDFRINDAFDKTENPDKLPSDKFFWFRLSGLNIYYTATKSDVNILGAISIETISNTIKTGNDASTEYITSCFTINDFSKNEWKICGLDEAEVKHWYCQIKTFLKEEDLVNCPVVDPKTNVVEKVVNITQPIIIIPLPSRQCNEKWNYQKDGDDWECDCAEGKEQAPIDLPPIKDAIDTSVRPLFQYERLEKGKVHSTFDGAYKKDNSNLKLELKENLLRIFHPKMGKIVTMDGAIYYAEEIVFHTPAEHTIDGKKYDLEVQIIHYGQTKGDIAKQIVLSFLFERTPGATNSFLEDINYFELPNPINTSVEIENTIFIPKILGNDEPDSDNNIISMEPFSFFTYQGSLTMPPCTEDSIMYVASTPLKIGATALQLFEEAQRIPDLMDGKGNVIISDWINKSARKIQPRNGRPVFHYDFTKFCAPHPPKPKEDEGHYEKIRKAIVNYFYVNGNEPSGLPNAYVVSEDEATGKGFDPRPRNQEKPEKPDK